MEGQENFAGYSSYIEFYLIKYLTTDTITKATQFQLGIYRILRKVAHSTETLLKGRGTWVIEFGPKQSQVW